MIPRPPTSTLFPYTTLSDLCHSDVVRPVAAETQVALSINPYHLGFAMWEKIVERSEEHTSELQSHSDLVCRLLLEKKKTQNIAERRTRRERQFRLGRLAGTP